MRHNRHTSACTPAERLFVPINDTDEQCTACGAINTGEGDSFASFGGCTDWWERCTACGRCVSGSNISAIL